MNHVALPRGQRGVVGTLGVPGFAGSSRQSASAAPAFHPHMQAWRSLLGSGQPSHSEKLLPPSPPLRATPWPPGASAARGRPRCSCVPRTSVPGSPCCPLASCLPLVRGCACACPDAPCAPPPDGRCHGRLCPGSTRASSAGPLTRVLWASEKGEARVCRALPRRAHGRDPPAARARPSTPAEGAAQVAGGTGYCSSGPCPRCARGLAALRVGPRPCRRDAQPGLPSLPRWLFLCPSRHTGWCRVALGDRDSG